MNYRKVEIQLQCKAEIMCSTWDCDTPKIVIDENREIITDTTVCAICDSKRIVIADVDNLMTQFYHELRHVWQRKFYRKVYDYWRLHPKYYELHDRLSIELDAMQYSRECVRSGQWQYAKGLRHLLDRDTKCLLDLEHSNNL